MTRGGRTSATMTMVLAPLAVFTDLPRLQITFSSSTKTYHSQSHNSSTNLSPSTNTFNLPYTPSHTMSTVVNVKGISASTPEKEIRDFFSFCGKIATLELHPDGTQGANGTQSATVTFEKETAAKTALLLDNTQLGPSQVQVTSASSTGTTTSSTSKAAENDGSADHEVEQEDKPRSRIFAEYLAHGYVISDKVIERGLALDQQQGISTRFTTALKNFDEKYKATDKAKNIDQQYAISTKANNAWAGLNSYFEKAASTPTGQKLRDFYLSTSQQVLDVHNEARHLANLKSPAPAGGASGTTDGTTEKATPSIEEAELEKVGDSGRTKCNCGADTGKCPCAPGQCACSNCSKNADVKA